MSFLELSATVARPGLEVKVELAADQGSVVGLIGPNGAGKSTFVQALCGMLPLASGRVSIGGVCWEDTGSGIRLAPQRRSVGVMFQGLLLFSNTTVLDNVAYAPRSLGASKLAAREKAEAILQRLGAAHLAGVRAGRLSGGQAQKVALARALATEPDLLLLDEPTSELDMTTRAEVRRTLSEALRDLGGVALVITHQPIEAMALAGQLLVMEGGRITQRGSPAELRLSPRSSYVAEFAGVNLFEGRSHGDRVELADGASVAVTDAPQGDVFVVIDPNAIALHRIAPEGTPRNVWRLRVASLDEEGDRVRAHLRGDITLVAEITRRAAMGLGLAPNDRLWASTKATQVHVYPR